MADNKVSELDTLASVDRTTDMLYVVDATGPTSNKITINSALGISNGNPVSTADTQTLTNKTLTTPTITVLDNALTVQDNSDPTKQLQLQLSGITTGTTRTLTAPNANTTIVGTDVAQTLTNKTLTSPTINTATIVNPTLQTDSISEYTAANGVTIDGVNIKDGALNTNNSVVTANITDTAVTPAKLQSGTGTSWAWQTWTPTVTNITVNNGVTIAKYCQIGKTVFFRYKFTLGTTSAIGTSPTITLPVEAAAEYLTTPEITIAEGAILDSGTGLSNVGLYYNSGSGSAAAFVFRLINSASTYAAPTNAITSTVPQTWAVNDAIYVQGFYEAA